jgi:acyl-CoA thioesterase
MDDQKTMNEAVEDALAARVAAALHAREPTSANWDIQIEEVRLGYSRIRMALREDMLNGHASAHGGILFAFADTAFAYACNSGNVVTVAAQASIIFINPARAGEVLLAEANMLAAAARSGAYAVHIRTDDGRAIAEFQGLARTIGGPVVGPRHEGEQHD